MHNNNIPSSPFFSVLPDPAPARRTTVEPEPDRGYDVGSWTEDDYEQAYESLRLLHGIEDAKSADNNHIISLLKKDLYACQKKLLNSLGHTESEQMLAGMLELNDNIAQAIGDDTSDLSKISAEGLLQLNDEVVQALGDNRDGSKISVADLEFDNSKISISAADIDFNNSKISAADIDFLANSRGEGNNRDRAFTRSFDAGDDNECEVGENTLPSVLNLMYILRRGDRKEMLEAVNQLLSFCYISSGSGKGGFNPQVNSFFPGTLDTDGIELLLQMDGIVKTVVTTLGRVAEWPDVLHQLSILLCFLIPLENDDSMLIRHANEILAAFYTTLKDLQVVCIKSKLQSTSRGNSCSNLVDGDHLNAISAKKTSKLFGSKKSLGLFSSSDELDPSVSEKSSGGDSNSIKQQFDLRYMFAAAMLRICSVLTLEWRKLSWDGSLEIPLDGSLDLAVSPKQNAFPSSIVEDPNDDTFSVHSVTAVAVDFVLKVSNSLQNMNTLSGAVSSGPVDVQPGKSVFDDSAAEADWNDPIASESVRRDLSVRRAGDNSNGKVVISSVDATKLLQILLKMVNSIAKVAVSNEEVITFTNCGKIRKPNTRSFDSNSAIENNLPSITRSFFQSISGGVSMLSSPSAGQLPAQVQPPAIEPHTATEPYLFKVDNASVLCSQMVSQLLKMALIRQSSICKHSLELILYWLNICCEAISILQLNGTSITSYTLFIQLLSNTSMAVLSATSTTESDGNTESKGVPNDLIPDTTPPPTRSGIRGSAKTGDYATGWTDAQLLSCEIPTAVVNLLAVSHGVSSVLTRLATTPLSTEGVEIHYEIDDDVAFPKQCTVCLVEALSNLASRPQNRSKLIEAQTHTLLYIIFTSMTIEEDVTCTDGNVSSDEEYLLNTHMCKSCLSAFNNFITTDDENLLVTHMLCRRQFVNQLHRVFVKYPPRSETRFAALRVMASLASWGFAIDTIMNNGDESHGGSSEGGRHPILVQTAAQGEDIAMDMTPAIVLMCLRMADVYSRSRSVSIVPEVQHRHNAHDKSYSSYATNAVDAISNSLNFITNHNSHHNVSSTSSHHRSMAGSSHLIKPPDLSRNVSDNSSFSKLSMTSTAWFDDANTGSDGGQVAGGTQAEECLLLCKIVANICSFKREYASRFYDSGIVPIVLRLLNKVGRGKYTGIEKSIIRCMSALCPVIVASSSSASSADLRSPTSDSTVLKSQNSGNSHHASNLVSNDITQPAGSALAHESSRKINTTALMNQYCSQILDCFVSSLGHPSSSVQLEAIGGILALINSDNESDGTIIKDAIVFGPLRTLISMLVNPFCDKEIRNLVEEVLTQLGFLNGFLDLELCQYDAQLLLDWYSLRRSSRLQKFILKTFVDKWINQDLFPPPGTHHELDSDDDDLSIYSGHNTDNSRRNSDSEKREAHKRSPSILMSSKRMSESKFYPVSGTSTVKKPSKMRRSVTEGIINYLPSSVQHFISTSRSSSSASADIEKSKSSEVVPVPQVQAPSILSFNKNTLQNDVREYIDMLNTAEGDEDESSRSLSATAVFSKLGMAPSARSCVLPCVPSNLTDDFGVALLKLGHTNTGFVNNYMLSSPSSGPLLPYGLTIDALTHYEGKDIPPIQMIDLLFSCYPSRLFHRIVLDTICLGQLVPVKNHAVSATNKTSIEDLCAKLSSNPYHEIESFSHLFQHTVQIPKPMTIQCILMPTRQYLSFKRPGRIIERTIEEESVSGADLQDNGAGQDKKGSEYGQQTTDSFTEWALTFRNSEFNGEFHSSLLSHLRTCPKIICLNFSCSDIVADSQLGYLGGNIPSSIKYLCFDRALSSESITSMCILLRQNNPALCSDRIGGPLYILPEARQGLQGLAIRNSVFCSDDVGSILSLLSVGGGKPSVARASGSKFSKKEQYAPQLPQLPIHIRQQLLSNPPGLRFLDLSDNNLSDAACAEIFGAACTGSIEALDLSGNAIQKGRSFIQAMRHLLPAFSSGSCKLRSLSVAKNNLPAKFLCRILNTLQENRCITSLDLSHNDFQHNVYFKEAIRQFLRKNTWLRELNLGHNKFNADSTKVMQLGMLENTTLLMLILMGNNGALNTVEYSIIQDRIASNRAAYYDASFSVQIAESVPMVDPMASPLAIATPIADRSLGPAGLTTPVLQRMDSDRGGSSVVATGTPVGAHTSPHVPVVLNETVPEVYDTVPLTPSTIGNIDSNIDNKPIVATRVILSSTTTSSSTVSSLSQASAMDTSHTTRQSETSSGRVVGRSTSGGQAAGHVPQISAPAGQVNSNVGNSNAPHKKQFDAIFDQFDDSELENRDSSFSSSAVSPVNNQLHVMFSSPLAWRDRSNNLHHLQMLDYPSERHAMSQVFKEVHRDISVHYDFATTDKLRTSLSFGCHALHFSGHGHPQYLNFEDGRAGLQLVSVEMLRELLQAGGLRLQFVFVSACYSRKTGEAFVEAGVPHVVCCKVDEKILNTAALIFTRAFYVALLSGDTVRHSFDIAKQALIASPFISKSDLEGDKFLLLPEDTSHDARIYTAKQVPFWPAVGHCFFGAHEYYSDEANNITNSNRSNIANSGNRGISFPNPPSEFEGREIDMYRVITTLYGRRLVSIVGEYGVGKSSLSAAVCGYMMHRNAFEDGVIFLKCQGISTYDAFLSALHSTIANSSIKMNTRLKAFTTSVQSKGGDAVYMQEEILVSCIGSLKCLLVLDHFNELLDSGLATVDINFLFGRIFSLCKMVKILITSTVVMGMFQGVVEYSVPLGALPVRNSLRLFARLTPGLPTSEIKRSFVDSLTPVSHKGVESNLAQGAVNSLTQDFRLAESKILASFGNGFPSIIVKMACEYYSAEAVSGLQRECMKYIEVYELQHQQYLADKKQQQLVPKVPTRTGIRTRSSPPLPGTSIPGGGSVSNDTTDDATTNDVQSAGAAATAATNDIKTAGATATNDIQTTIDSISVGGI